MTRSTCWWWLRKHFLNGVIEDSGPATLLSGVQLIPVKKINGQAVTGARVGARVAACDILDLVPGPLDLNILGLLNPGV